MKVNVVSRKLIKPCTPTPQNLNKYKISSKDELIAPMNVSILLFYPSKPKPFIHLLEESLSEILSQFYPLAGRYIKKDYTVDCSDQGAEFVEAEAVDVDQIIDVIKTTNNKQLNELLPRQSDQVDKATDPLLSIQVTVFKCGGLAIGVSVSHRIFDGSSVGTFVAAWSSNAAANEGKTTITPSFDSPMLFPGRNLSYHPEHIKDSRSIVVKRFLFKKEAIRSLRSKLKPPKDGSKALSRVRVVCAVIAKALICVERAKNGKKSRPCLIVQSVNMRHRMIPPLPKHSCGNLVIHSVAEFMPNTLTDHENEAQDHLGIVLIQEIVCLLSDAIENTVSGCAEVLSLQDNSNVIISHETSLIERSKSWDVNDLSFTDWSKFGYYEVDFGWGKPDWVAVGALPVENVTVVMDNKEGDGIEAWVHLNHNDVCYFDQDEDVKLFTT